MLLAQQERLALPVRTGRQARQAPPALGVPLGTPERRGQQASREKPVLPVRRALRALQARREPTVTWGHVARLAQRDRPVRQGLLVRKARRANRENRGRKARKGFLE